MSDDCAERDNELDGPYFDERRAQFSEHITELTERYEEKYGVTVPVINRQQVRETALKSDLPPGTNWWLEVALAIASAQRRDLDRSEFQRVFALATRGDLTFELNPQPIQILTAMAAVRPPKRRRKTGPPPSDTVNIDQVRSALAAWRGAWPPTQQTFANLSLGGLGDRRLRQILHQAETSWERELELGEQQRAASS